MTAPQDPPEMSDTADEVQVPAQEDPAQEAPPRAPAPQPSAFDHTAGARKRAAPDPFRLAGDPPSVMRLSRKALTILGVVATATIAGAVIYAMQPRSHEQAENLIDTQSRNKAESVTSAPGDYASVPKLGEPLPGDLGRPILSAQEGTGTAPVPDAARDRHAAVLEQARQRRQAEHDTARTSRLFLGASTGQGAPVGSSAPVSAAPADAGAAAETQSAGMDQTGKRAFLQVGPRKPTASAERITDVPSPYVLQAGSIIPAALITGIRSDLPGQITAQVTQNVYDSPTGRILLIPQGSRLIGEYDSGVSAGQNRALLAWDRLILPGGRSILLDRQPGADAAGMAGLQDRTNYHWGSMMKAALISTFLSFGTELGSDSDDALIEALRNGNQDTLSQTGRQLVQRQMNLAPTITIRPGFALRVIVTRDLVLEPAQGGR